MIAYYDQRADEYDATSWEGATTAEEIEVAMTVSEILGSLAPASTLDIGCGTGYVSRWLDGQITLLDSSPAMLAIAKRRLPHATIVRATAPLLPFSDHSFDRAFTASFFGHLVRSVRSELINEMHRVADEMIILDQLSPTGTFSEGPEQRQLIDGSRFTIHKCYFTIERLLKELPGGEVLMAGPIFGIVRVK